MLTNSAVPHQVARSTCLKSVRRQKRCGRSLDRSLNPPVTPSSPRTECDNALGRRGLDWTCRSQSAATRSSNKRVETRWTSARLVPAVRERCASGANGPGPLVVW